MSLGGSILAYNCISQDYCLKETLECLAELCDQISIVVCRSTDGTNELVDGFRAGFGSDCVVSEAKWSPDGANKCDWIRRLRELGRSKLSTDQHVLMDADEVFHEDQYDLIRSVGGEFFINYFNFWRDHTRYVTGQVVYGCRTVRIGRTSTGLIGDGGSIAHDEAMECPYEKISLYHYGYIKNPLAFVENKRRFQMELVGTYDRDFDIGMDKFFTRYDEHTIPFSGEHPRVMRKWLSARMNQNGLERNHNEVCNPQKALACGS